LDILGGHLAARVDVGVPPCRCPHCFSRDEPLDCRNFSWLYVASVGGFLLFTVYLAFSRFGEQRLGLPTDRPEFSTWSWLSMLFSAGMGIGLLFYSVGEPIQHYLDPPRLNYVDMSIPGARATVAMRTTFFHWGLHACRPML
jgi:choline-glycine betaine transporter